MMVGKAVPILALLLLDFRKALQTLEGTSRIRSPWFQRLSCLEAAVSDTPSTSESDDGLLSTSKKHLSRRSFFHRSTIFTTASFGILSLSTQSQPAYAAATQQRQRQPLADLLYRILRVREATQQEARLIRSGKFKDVQRANVKLAVKFMVDNYRLNDAFVAASAYLDGNAKRVEAGQVGTTAVQNLYTILEYFDSSDVQNLKVCISVCICLCAPVECVWRESVFSVQMDRVSCSLYTSG